ncbi:hypothetical protein OUZ56_033358 [Daphnia magna]|uniref:Peptidase S59 domain-containing protein n=1 Tax=Daphnia magna TaxID=35525 RepID=A0ABQ9ZXY1_9CRUS|nr:hypothetical protein OUZ56_033358 [Daphnia magna]
MSMDFATLAGCQRTQKPVYDRPEGQSNVKYKLIISQRIRIEYKSKNSWYHSVFTLNTSILDSVYMSKYKLMKYKFMVSQCIHIEYRSKNSWYQSVFSLNTKVKLMIEEKTHVIPSLEELAKQGLDQNGECIVTSFTIIRQGYGKILFEGPLDVAHLNLDDIVSMGCKMVAVYPDVSMKPSEGEGLNRRAEITLYSLWPLDKSTGNYITYPQYQRNRSTLPRFENRFARDLHNIQATFIFYSPEKGALRFQLSLIRIISGVLVSTREDPRFLNLDTLGPV